MILRNWFWQSMRLLCMAVLAMGVVACEEIGADEDEDDDDSTVMVEGRFVDSPVAGLGYRVDGDDGLTASDGGFEYTEGDDVRFFHGNTNLGKAPGQAFVTPRDLDVCDSATEVTFEECAINIVRFLLTHKDDGASTIELDEDARNDAAILSPVDFDVDPDLFGTVNDTENPQLQNYLATNSGEGRSGLASVSEAETHLDCTEEDIAAGREPDGVCDETTTSGTSEDEADRGAGSEGEEPNPLSPAALCAIPTLGPALVEAVGESCEGGGSDTELSPAELCAVPVLGPLVVEGAGSSCE